MNKKINFKPVCFGIKYLPRKEDFSIFEYLARCKIIVNLKMFFELTKKNNLNKA